MVFTMYKEKIIFPVSEKQIAKIANGTAALCLIKKSDIEFVKEVRIILFLNMRYVTLELYILRICQENFLIKNDIFCLSA